MSHGATSACGGMVVPLAPAKGLEAAREVMEGNRRMERAVPPSCCALVVGTHQRCSPKGDPEHPQPWAKQGAEGPWGRRGTSASLAAPACPRILLLLKRARELSYSPSTACQRCVQKEGTVCTEPAATQAVVCVCVPADSDFSGGVPQQHGLHPLHPRGPACHASHAGLLWKADDSLGSGSAGSTTGPLPAQTQPSCLRSGSSHSDAAWCIPVENGEGLAGPATQTGRLEAPGQESACSR